jgi:hypothetical protein
MTLGQAFGCCCCFEWDRRKAGQSESRLSLAYIPQPQLPLRNRVWGWVVGSGVWGFGRVGGGVTILLLFERSKKRHAHVQTPPGGGRGGLGLEGQLCFVLSFMRGRDLKLRPNQGGSGIGSRMCCATRNQTIRCCGNPSKPASLCCCTSVQPAQTIDLEKRREDRSIDPSSSGFLKRAWAAATNLRSPQFSITAFVMHSRLFTCSLPLKGSPSRPRRFPSAPGWDQSPSLIAEDS